MKVSYQQKYNYITL